MQKIIKTNFAIFLNIFCLNFAIRLSKKDFALFLCFLPFVFALLFCVLFIFYFMQHFYFLGQFSEISSTTRLNYALDSGIYSWQFLITPLLFCLHFAIFYALNSRLKFIFLFLNFYLIYCLLLVPLDINYLTIFAIFYTFLLILGIILIFFKSNEKSEITSLNIKFLIYCLIFIILNIAILWYFGSGDIKRTSSVFELFRISMSASIWLFIISLFSLIYKFSAFFQVK